MSPQEPSPLFIVGCPRSGNTLLACILCRHPDFFVFFERSTLAHLYQSWTERRRREPDEPPETSFTRVVLDAWAGWIDERTTLRVEPREVRLCAERGEGGYGAMLHETMMMLMHQVKPRAAYWGDKTPHHTGCLTDIQTVFPEARIVHIRRDPRSVVHSLSKPEFHPASDDPLFNTEIIRQYWQSYQGEKNRIDATKVHEVRYEELIKSPEPVLNDLCEFLGIPYTGSLLEEAPTKVRKATGWPNYKGWGELIVSSAEPPPIRKTVFAAIAGLGRRMGYDLPRASLRARLTASIRLLPTRLAHFVMRSAYRMRYSRANRLFIQKPIGLEDVRRWIEKGTRSQT